MDGRNAGARPFGLPFGSRRARSRVIVSHDAQLVVTRRRKAVAAAAFGALFFLPAAEATKRRRTQARRRDHGSAAPLNAPPVLTRAPSGAERRPRRVRPVRLSIACSADRRSARGTHSLAARLAASSSSKRRASSGRRALLRMRLLDHAGRFVLRCGVARPALLCFHVVRVAGAARFSRSAESWSAAAAVSFLATFGLQVFFVGFFLIFF